MGPINTVILVPIPPYKTQNWQRKLDMELVRRLYTIVCMFTTCKWQSAIKVEPPPYFSAIVAFLGAITSSSVYYYGVTSLLASRIQWGMKSILITEIVFNQIILLFLSQQKTALFLSKRCRRGAAATAALLLLLCPLRRRRAEPYYFYSGEYPLWSPIYYYIQID